MIDCNAQPQQRVSIIKGVKDGTRAFIHYAAGLPHRAATNARLIVCLCHITILCRTYKTAETQPEEGRLRSSVAITCPLTQPALF